MPFSVAWSVSQTLTLRRACACLALWLPAMGTAGCCGTGIYSVQYNQPAIAGHALDHAEIAPAGASCGDSCAAPEISLGEAVAAFCGPPELCHPELMATDPHAIVAPPPKYHPLPTRPVFEAGYSLPSMALGAGAAPVEASAIGPTAERSAAWRGPLPRNESQRWAAADRVAYNPVANVKFPPRPALEPAPALLDARDAHPLRPQREGDTLLR